jgi:hypothetical protein
MPQRRISVLLIPLSTFILGIFVQALFDQWFNSKNLMVLSILMIMVGLVTALIVLKQMDRRFDNIDTKLLDIANRTGLKAEFIEDQLGGRSYLRSTQLIEEAKTSIIAVDTWKSSPGYLNSSSQNVKEARSQQYEALKKQIKLHLGDSTPFHRRIVQIPQEYENKNLPFNIDPPFYNYLIAAAEAQDSNPRSCLIRRTSTIISTHFILIDERYIIMPLVSYIKDEAQVRYGALIFDDVQGNLVNYLKSIYSILDGRSKPIELHHLTISK